MLKISKMYEKPKMQKKWQNPENKDPLRENLAELGLLYFISKTLQRTAYYDHWLSHELDESHELVVPVLKYPADKEWRVSSSSSSKLLLSGQVAPDWW